MSKSNSKLMLAGVLVAFAFGGIALGSAWATPSSGLTTTMIAGPTLLGEVEVKGESEINEVEIETKGKVTQHTCGFCSPRWDRCG